MENKNTPEDKIPKSFFRQFKSKESFRNILMLFKQGIEEMLQSELNEHLGYTKHDKEGYNTGNSRNDSFSKTVTTENAGDVVLNISRDRNGKLEPQIIPKGQTISSKNGCRQLYIVTNRQNET
jgi:putative transposase